MKVSFSTLACPDWSLAQIIAIATAENYDGIELRFVQGEDSLWKLPAFSRPDLAATIRNLKDHNLSVSCLDTSCRFDSSDADERKRWITEGARMADLAAELGAPGLRVFGDTIQSGADRASTQSWIADSIRELAHATEPKGIEIWIENHGDFVTASQTMTILMQADCLNTGVVWDPANSLAATQEDPAESAALLGAAIRHVHLKDIRRHQDKWEYVLTGEGEFPFRELMIALDRLRYSGYVSFEWEKKWHPEIAGPEIALPHFARWFRENFVHG